MDIKMRRMWLFSLIIIMPGISYADNCFIQDIHGNCLQRERAPTPQMPTQQIEQQSTTDSSLYQPQQQTEQTLPKTDIESEGSEVMNGFLGFLFLIFAGSSIYACSKAYRGEMLFFHDWSDASGSILITILALIASENSQIFLGVLLWLGAVIYNGYRVYGVYSNDKVKLALVTVSRIMVSLLIPFLFVLIICSFFIGDKKSKGKGLASTLGGIGMLAGLTYFLNRLVNRCAVQETHEEGDPKLTMELKYTPRKEVVINAYQPRLARVSSRKEKAQSGDDCWLKKDSVINIQGFNITHGMIYVGQGLYKGSYNPSPYLRNSFEEVEQCLINPSLFVDKSNIDIEARSLPYYPSYSEVAPAARANYLHWLETGASDSKAYIGYVFLYFYGLERRFFLDKSKSEWPIIIEEVKRLREIFSNVSFQRYAGEFLSKARVSIALESGERLYKSPPIKLDYYSFFETPLDIKVALSQMVKDGERLKADLALAWIHTDQLTSFRTPVRRARQEFESLFAEKYTDEFPEGLTIEPNSRTITASCYRAASASFEVDLNLKDLPDVSEEEKPKEQIRSIVETCTNLLEPYSRFLGKNPDKIKSVEALLLLPPELQEKIDHPGLMKIKDVLIKDVETKGRINIKAKEIIKIWPVKDSSKMSKKESESLSNFLQRFKVGIVPDVIYGDRELKSTDYAILFKLPGDQPSEENKLLAEFRSLRKIKPQTFMPSEGYKLASIFLELAMMVALADDQISQGETAHLMERLEGIFKLPESEKIRLEAKMEYLIKNKIALNRPKGNIAEQIPAAKRPEIASYLLTLVGADGRIESSEVKVLARIYKYLGLPEEQLYSDLNGLGAHSIVKTLDDPVTVRKGIEGTPTYKIPEPPKKQEGALVLNMDIVHSKVKDTEEVSKLLRGVFINEEPVIEGEEKEKEEVNEQSPLSSLDKLHQTLLIELCLILNC